MSEQEDGRRQGELTTGREHELSESGSRSLQENTGRPRTQVGTRTRAPAKVQLRMSRDAALREELPYGVWICADGREVLFNRSYTPIWERRPGERARRANPSEWVQSVEQRWFFNDGCPPWKNARTRAHCEQILDDWWA